MPRKYSRISSRATSYTKESLQLAMQRINNKELTYAAASKLYGIPTSTLSDRILKKTGIVSDTLGRPTSIPVALEAKLANCLRTLEKWGWGLSREEVLDVTQEFIKRNKIQTPFNDDRPGPDWFLSFRQRHNLSIKKPQPVEYLRKKMTDPFIINEYFTILEKTLHELELSDPKRIWNLDETSVCLDPTKTKVVGARGEPCTRTTCGTAKENITVLTTVNAAGQKLDPLIVFKGRHMYKQWMLESPEKYDFNLAYAASKRGWMETNIFYDYMLKVIIPNLGEDRPVLLLYDGHVSHVDDKVVALAVENNITILKLPAHTSHLLQPLDLAVFKSFKAIWDKSLVKWQRQNVGTKLRKQNFAKMFAEAWQETKPQVIRNGFKKGGIYPFNPAIIPKQKYDPAAYARWQKHIAPVNFKQPKSLIQICVDEIYKMISLNGSTSTPNNNIAYSETLDSPTLEHRDRLLQPLATFEQLLLEKVSQHSQNSKNNVPVKLKRIAKGAEVITKSFLEKQKTIELTKEKEKQKTIKRKQKTVLESKNDHNKVSILSSAKITPDNQALYKILPGSLQLKSIDKDFDLFTNQKRKLSQNTSVPNKPKKKTKKVNYPIKTTTKYQKDFSGNCIINIDKDDVATKNDIDDSNKYNIGDTVLVRYFKRSWTFYVGIIEGSNINSNPNMYNITFYKTIGKKNDLKFVIPKRKDQDYVPDSNIVKVIELLQINEDPVEYTLMNDDDEDFF